MHSGVRALSGVALLAAIASAAGCASSGARPQPFPSPPGGPMTEAPGPSRPERSRHGDGYEIASAALQLQGIPYRPGGSDLKGFDCSGLVQYVLALQGVAVPRVVRDQFQVGRRVRLGDLEPGDLVFFTTEGRAVSHVGIVIGGDRFVHAPNARGTVRIDSLVSGYWGERVAGARRVN